MGVQNLFLIEFFTQMVVMLRKNFTLLVRYRLATLTQVLFAPLFILALLRLLQVADNQALLAELQHPTSYPLPPMALCTGNCITVMFAPNTAPFTNIMSNFVSLNNDRMARLGFNMQPLVVSGGLQDMTPPTSSLGVVGVPDDDFVYQHIITYPNTTQFAITFYQTDANTYQYQIWYNSTSTSNLTDTGVPADTYGTMILTMMRGLDESLITQLSGTTDPVRVDVDLKDWPIIPSLNANSDRIVSQMGPTFLFCSGMFIFIAVANTIMMEKELKLRSSLQTAGLRRSVYWLSWFVTHCALVALSSAVICLLGIAFNFSVFSNSSFIVVFALFFFFGMAMITMAYFITTLCRQTQVAILICILIFIVGLLVETLVFGQAFVGYLWWDRATNPALRYIFQLFPFFNFGRILLDVATLAQGNFDPVTEIVVKGNGYSLSNLFNPLPASVLPIYSGSNMPTRPPDLPPTIFSFLWLIGNIVMFYFLTWYFDHVIADEYGQRESFLFFLKPSYYGIFMNTKLQAVENLKKADNSRRADPNEDSDVRRERDLCMDFRREFALRMMNLRKVYPGGKVAVDSFCLGLEQGKLLGLLGQNGAGKSTSISILTGLTPPSHGDAFISGYSVRYEMHKIRRIMGVCPQHDILFDDLTAREHIQLYGGLKHLSAQEIDKIVKERLESVRLTKVADKPVRAYSGGMKRRLSVVLSTVGDPSIIFMDEPTTGMDPVNRKAVWQFIETFKRNRCIVLTTHSMLEADVLGDRIAVMAHGKLHALGTSIHLKAKFGTGYRISLVTSQRHSDLAKDRVAEMVPMATLEDDTAGSLIYQFPVEAINTIPEFVDYLERDPDRIIKGWGISNSTLEEVFLRLIRAANPHGYNVFDGGVQRR